MSYDYLNADQVDNRSRVYNNVANLPTNTVVDYLQKAWKLHATGGHLIESIKLYRLIYGTGLKESKDAVEHYRDAAKYEEIHNTFTFGQYNPVQYQHALIAAGMSRENAKNTVLMAVEKKLNHSLMVD